MKSESQSVLLFDISSIRFNIVKRGVMFGFFFQGAELVSGIKNDVFYTEDHLGLKNGGQ